MGGIIIYLLTLEPVKGSSRDHQNIYNVGVVEAWEEMVGAVSNFSLFLRGRLKLQSAKAEEEDPRHHRYQTDTQTW